MCGALKGTEVAGYYSAEVKKKNSKQPFWIIKTRSLIMGEGEKDRKITRVCHNDAATKLEGGIHRTIQVTRKHGL